MSKTLEFDNIPEGWGLVKVNDILELLTDYEANGSFEHVKLNVKVYDEPNYAWYVRATDLENNTSLDKVKYVDEKSYTFLHKTKLYGDEVLITKRGEIGKVYYFDCKTHKATLAPNLYLLKINNKVIARYLYYYFISDLGQLQLTRNNASTTLGALYKDDVKLIPLLLPSIAEQNSITDVMTSIDDLIKKTSALIEKYKNIKTGLMQDLFTRGVTEGGKLRPSYSEAPELYKPSDLGFIPREWDVKKLAEVLKLNYGDSPKQIMDENGRYEVWGTGGISCYGNDYLYDGESILIGRKGTIDKPLYLKGKFWVIDTAFYATDFVECNVKWAYYYLTTVNFKLYNEATGVPSLSRATIEKIQLKVPKLPEQRLIKQKLEAIDKRIATEQAHLDKLKCIKQGLMQDLLTGKKRVKVENIEAQDNVIELKPVKDVKTAKPVNIAFKRAVLEAEGMLQLHSEPTYGSTKREKLDFLFSYHAKADTTRQFYRQAAGPYDNSGRRSSNNIIMNQNKWFKAVRTNYGEKYEPDVNFEKFVKGNYFERYYSEQKDEIQRIITLFKNQRTSWCEIVATLYAIWNDFLLDGKNVSDEVMISEFHNNWHKDKIKYPKEQLYKALNWMREKELVPSGVGLKTKVAGRQKAPV